jgi:MYXO-CTERM domain-containing protein
MFKPNRTITRSPRAAAGLALLTAPLALIAPNTRAGGPDEDPTHGHALGTSDQCVTHLQPAPAPEKSGEPHDPRAPAVIFVNMDGATLNCTNGYNDDSHTNTSWVCGSYAGNGPYNYAAYNGNKQALLDATKADWQPFNVSVVSTRPGSGNYTMCMTGPSNFIGGGVLGVAPLDCYDSVKNNVVFAFVGSQHGVDTAATTISQEVAHAYGLEHVNGQSDIMYPSVQVNQSFQDQCLGIVQGGQCGQQHAANCGGGQQNSYQDLMDLFGPSMPDMADPTVTITSPMDGAVFMAGSDFTITVDAQDDVEIATVELFVNDQTAGQQTSPPFEWPAMGVPEGTHEFYAIAVDGWGNEAMSNVVTVQATQDGTTGSSGSSGSAGDGDGDGDGGDGDGDGDSGNTTDAYPGNAFPPGYGEGDYETGCGCSAPAAAGFGGLGLLVLPALRRRRARA